MNTGVSWPSPELAEQRVLAMQSKLHRWAVGDPDRRFDDLYNLVHDPAFIVVAWTRVRSNRGARTAGVDGKTAHAIEARALTQRRCWTICRSRPEGGHGSSPLAVRERDDPQARRQESAGSGYATIR